MVLIGLGKLGLTVAAGLLERPDIEIVRAVDLDPNKANIDVAALVGRPPIGVPVTGDWTPSCGEADVALVMTSSRVADIVDLITIVLSAGINVLTSAEELVHPWVEFPHESARLHELAQEHNVTLLGAGANPGFLMDVLPVVLSLATQRIERLQITRAMDLRPHRAARLSRFALGETLERFAEIPDSLAHGHIGFGQSIAALADALHLSVDSIIDRPLRPVVITVQERTGEFVSIGPGRIAVVSQGAIGMVSGREIVTLEEYFGFLEPEDEIPTGDNYQLDGVDQQFSVKVRPGVMSFATTPAVLINMLIPVVEADPGLKGMLDFPVRDLASKGATALSEPTDGAMVGA